MIGVFRGGHKEGQGKPAGEIATGYSIGRFAIDSPEGVFYPNNPLILITHAHCDHICGLNSHNHKYACSKECAIAIEKTDERAMLCSHLGFAPPRRMPAETLEGGQVLDGGDFTIEVIETPGHAEGSLCFYVPQLKALFSGDTVFGENFLPSLSLPTSNPAALADTYEKLSNYDVEKICPGHGSPFSANGYIRSLLPIVREFI
jgi:hydroxyacylglutathione hydrolase